MKRVLLSVFGAILIFPFTALAQSKAGLVIQNSTGEVITRCVEFEEETISVETLLERSGFKLVVEQKSWGASVKYIHDDGVQAGESHADGWFWNFYQHDGNDWVMSDVGVTSAEAKDGTIFGFVFGAWDETKPPQKTFADVCEITSLAGLVIDHSDGTRVVRVVEFPGETITGYQLLLNSGLDLISNQESWGTSICSIDGEGMPAEECFDDPEGRYWGFNLLDSNDAWVSSPVGAGDAVVYDRDVHGYLYATWGTIQPTTTRVDILGETSAASVWESLR